MRRCAGCRSVQSQETLTTTLSQAFQTRHTQHAHTCHEHIYNGGLAPPHLYPLYNCSAMSSCLLVCMSFASSHFISHLCRLLIFHMSGYIPTCQRLNLYILFLLSPIYGLLHTVRVSQCKANMLIAQILSQLDNICPR